MTHKKNLNKLVASHRLTFSVCFGAFVIFGMVNYILPNINASEFEQNRKTEDGQSIIEDKKVLHLKTPEPLKAVYMTSCVASTPKLRYDLVSLIDKTEINSIVIDIKDYTGYISYTPKNEELASYASKRCLITDLEDFIEELHKKSIYVIGRITVFQDPLLAVRKPELGVKKKSDTSALWKDHKGIHFTDPGSTDVWKHNLSIAKESYDIGFDELNFDYIRYPSDGPMSDIYFSWDRGRTKSEVIEDFFAFLSRELKPLGVVTSADLFGMTTTNIDDLNIGQVLEKAAPHFNYIAPMVYPSHYPKGFNGWADPNKFPYEVIKYSMSSAVKRFLATSTPVAFNGAVPIASTSKFSKESWDPLKLRPWIQDFDYGGNYDITEVRAQIKATYDSGLTSWMLWSPSNRYTAGALEVVPSD